MSRRRPLSVKTSLGDLVLRSAYRAGGFLPRSVKRSLNRLMNTSFLVGVVGVVFDDDGRVVALRHTYRPRAPWSLPSGWLARSDTIEECLVREIREEAGLEAGFVAVIDAVREPGPAQVTVWVLHRLRGGSFRASAEVDGLALLGRDELDRLPESQRTVLSTRWDELVERTR